MLSLFTCIALLLHVLGIVRKAEFVAIYVGLAFLGCSELLWAALGCSGLLWAVLGKQIRCDK